MVIIFLITSFTWIYKDQNVVDKHNLHDEVIIFQLHPRIKNASIDEIISRSRRHEQRNYYRLRRRVLGLTKLNYEQSPIWEVKSLFWFLYIKLSIGRQTFDVLIDTGSPVLWLNCKIPHLNVGPSPNLVSDANLNPKYFLLHDFLLQLWGHNIHEVKEKLFYFLGNNLSWLHFDYGIEMQDVKSWFNFNIYLKWMRERV